jgi:peptide/nickel transport system substrate-binding protein
VLAWSGRADPDGNLQNHLGCGAPLNYSGFCSKEVDQLIADSRAEREPAKRAQIYERIAAHILKERPIIYLFHRHWIWGHSAKLSGFRTVPDGMVRVQGLKLN